MAEALSIWSQVVVGESGPRSFAHHQIYDLEERYRGMEDLKIKLRDYIIRKQGNALETWFNLEIYCLLESMDGKMQLLKKEEKLRDRVLLQEFDPELDFDKEAQLSFIGDVQKVDRQGGLEDRQLHVIIFIEYVMLVIRQQVVCLGGKESALEDSMADSLAREESVIMEQNNLELRRQLRFYEKNIANLKKGIEKAENRNALLNRESRQHRALIEELRRSINEKEQRLDGYEARYYHGDNTGLYEELRSDNNEDEKLSGNNWGRRVKQLFLDSF